MTLNLYDYYWQRWSTWCVGQAVDLICPTEPIVAEYLTLLFEHVGLAVATIKTIRLAISRTLSRSATTNPAMENTILDLVQNFAKERPVSLKLMPLFGPGSLFPTATIIRTSLRRFHSLLESKNSFPCLLGLGMPSEQASLSLRGFPILSARSELGGCHLPTRFDVFWFLLRSRFRLCRPSSDRTMMTCFFALFGRSEVTSIEWPHTDTTVPDYQSEEIRKCRRL